MKMFGMVQKKLQRDTLIPTTNVFLSDTDFEQSNQDDSTEQMVIVLAVSGVALVAIFVTVVIVVMLLRGRYHSSEQTKTLAPGTPTRTHAWGDVGMRTDT